LELYGSGQLKLEELLDYYVDHYNENVVSDFNLRMAPTFGKYMGDSYYEKGLKFFETFQGFPFKILETELRFDLPYNEEYNLNGQIDVVAQDNDGLLVVDYKSKGNWKSKEERLKYEKQLYFYAWAVKQLYGVYPAKMAFYMFRIDKWTWVNFDENRLKEVLKWVEEEVENINDEFEFEPITETDDSFNFFCNNFCDFRHSCPYGQLNS